LAINKITKDTILGLVGVTCLVVATKAGTTVYRDIILGDNPVVYYEFDETSGTTAENSGSLGAALNGTITNPVTLGQGSFLQGGVAYDFRGGRVTMAPLTSSLTEWTVEAWVNTDGSKKTRSHILSNDQGGWNDDVLFGLGVENGNLGVPAGSIGLIQQAAPGGPRDYVKTEFSAYNAWRHVVVTASESAGVLKLYIDGALVDTDSSMNVNLRFNGGDGIGTAHLTVGSRSGSTDSYQGLLDELAIYDSVLGDETILGHFNASTSSPGTPPTIVDLSPMLEATEVLIFADLVATFSEPMVLTGAGNVMIRNLKLGTEADATIDLPDPQISVSGLSLKIDPTNDLELDTTYAIRISADALEDISNDAFTGILNDSYWNFKTVTEPDTTAPTILSKSPADNAEIVAPTVDLVVSFDESVTLTGVGSVTIRNLTLGPDSDILITLPNEQVSISGKNLIINPSVDLSFSTSYAIQISGDAVQDLSRNTFTGILNDTSWNLTSMDELPEGSITPGAWSLVILPDTQKYSENNPGIFSAQTAWIRDNVRRRNIRYVLHLGDIVDDNNDLQWGRSLGSMKVLNGAIPYTIVGGNHDYGPGGKASTRDTLMNDYFSYTEIATWPTFGGSMEVGKLDNTYHLFEAGGTEWIIFNLEWGPRDSTIAWAREIYNQNQNRKGILVTHAYMYSDDTRYDWATKGGSQNWNPHAAVYSTPGGVNDGQELWDKFVKDYNFAMTLNGHVLNDGTGYLLENNLAGEPVHQMLINYQMRSLGGEGYMRILEFQPDGQTVNVTSYSAVYDSFLTTSDHQFSFSLPLGAVDANGNSVLDYYDPKLDSDGDGVSNYNEFVVHGTHTQKADSDGDKIRDAEEIAARTDPLRNDATTVSLIQSDPASFNLFTDQMILDLNTETIFQIDGEDLILNLQMRRSNDLKNWIDEGAPIKWSIPKPTDKQFLRLRIGEP
jgi:hypothetical protein